MSSQTRTVISFFWQFVLIGGSLLLVSLSQPDWSPLCCVITAACGYALFWKGLLFCPTRIWRFALAALWFFGVQAIHLNWFMADHYVGSLIYIFLFLLYLALAIFFGLLSLFVQKPQDLTIWRMLGIAGGWTLFEWARLFFLSGFSWDPLGFSLSATLSGMQLAAAFGVFGLTFWVLLTNLFALRWLQKAFQPSFLGVWLILALIPYVYGQVTLFFHEKQFKEQKDTYLSTLLVQTSLYPEQKVALAGPGTHTFTPKEQWERILLMLKKHQNKEIDLIAFSEAVVPYGTDLPLFTIESISNSFEKILGIPLLYKEAGTTQVGNAYWAQAIANYFKSDVVIGLEDASYTNAVDASPQVFNAAFLFRADNQERQRYEKRVLVPLGEYIPFQWCRKILTRYGIEGSFSPGSKAKVFEAKKLPVGMSICYEETYGHLMRENRLQGAELLINLTNDVWYPHSRLPIVHYMHGRLRSIETGIPVVRASNTGVTCAIDSLGRTLAMLPFEDVHQNSTPDVLYVQVPMYNYPTLYMRYGDQLIIWFSILSVFVSLSAAFLPLPKPVLEKVFSKTK